ncbi:pilus assembly protein TadG-related protein [Bacillus sp. N9]
MKRLLRIIHFREERGGVAVYVALFMVVLLGITALVIDGGRLYTEKSKLQKAMDAAVLAGAQRLALADGALSVSKAKLAAKELSQQNGYSLSDTDIEAIHKTYVKASKEIDVSLTFAKVLGFNSAAVSASAKAIVAPIKSTGRITPVAMEESIVKNAAPGEEIDIVGDNHSTGNWGFLNVSGAEGGGSSELKKAIKNGVFYLLMMLDTLRQVHRIR